MVDLSLNIIGEWHQWCMGNGNWIIQWIMTTGEMRMEDIAAKDMNAYEDILAKGMPAQNQPWGPTGSSRPRSPRGTQQFGTAERSGASSGAGARAWCPTTSRA